MSKQTSQQAYNICKIDIASITPFQEELHLIRDKDEELESVYTYQIKKTSWGTHIPVCMDQEENSGSLIFTTNNRFDFLLSTTLHQVLPPVTLTKEAIDLGVEICWPHNIGHNVINEAQLHFGDDPAQKLIPLWLDIHSHFFMKPGFEKKYSHMIGSVPALENWNVELPRWKLKVPQPWYYSIDQSWAIPMCRCSKTRIKHIYKTKTKIFDLLRVRCKNEDNTHKIVKPIAQLFKNISKDDAILDKPELWAKYAVVNDNERIFHSKRDPDFMYIQDIVHVQTDNPHSYGESASLDLVGDRPCSALFWVAQNNTSLTNGNLSNYTTNSENVYKGWSPISDISVKHGTSYRFEEMSADYFNDDVALDSFPSAPRESGYFGYSFTHDIDRPNINIGKCLGQKKTKLIAQLKNMDPYLELEKIRKNSNESSINSDKLKDLINNNGGNSITQSGDKFFLHAIMLVVRKLRFIRNPQTGVLEDCKVTDDDIEPVL